MLREEPEVEIVGEGASASETIDLVGAFEIHAVDYLLKLFTSERLHSAVQRAREQIYATKQIAGRSSSRGQNGSSYTYRLQVSGSHSLSLRLRRSLATDAGLGEIRVFRRLKSAKRLPYRSLFF